MIIRTETSSGRARQISQGSPKLTSIKVESDVTTAAIEIDEGKVTVSK